MELFRSSGPYLFRRNRQATKVRMPGPPLARTPHPCVVCAHPSTTKCSGCKRVYYCSRGHQELAWNKHKGLCKIYQMKNPPDPSTYCGLCGKQGRLTRTECCNRLVCDDRDDTILFIPSRPQCEYMHARYTVCSVHHNDGHDGAIDWRECAQCRVYFAEFESYVGFGTSSFNFAEDQWDEVPTFEPTYCSKCKGMMKLNSEAHSALPDGNMLCERCCGFS